MKGKAKAPPRPPSEARTAAQAKKAPPIKARNKARNKKGTAAVARYRERMKRQGFRLLQIWVPDTRAPGFAAEYARQAALLSKNDDPNLEAWLEQNAADVQGWE